MAKLPDATDLMGSRPALTIGGGVSAARPEPIPRLGAEAEGLLQLGHALGTAGHEAAVASMREKERYDATRTEDAFNQLRAKQLDLTAGQENGFTNLKGGDAVNKPVLKDWSQKFDEQTEQIASTLTDERQKERFRLRAGVARAEYTGDIMKHVAHQGDVYAQNVYKGTVDLETRNAMTNWDDPQAIGLSIERIDNAVKQEASRAGWSPESLAAARMHQVSGLHASVIAQALQNGETTYAQKYFETNKESIDPAVVKTLGHEVENGVQKELAVGYQTQFLSSRDDTKGLSALDARVSTDPNLDDQRRNVLVGQIRSRMDVLEIRQAREEDKRMRTIQRGIDGVNKLTLAGYEPTAEQILPLVSAAKGTELEGDVQQMIAVAGATKQFRLATPQQQESAITSMEAQARKDPTKFDVTVIDRFKKIYANQQQDLKSDPTTFAIRQGLVRSDDPAAQPLDLSDPAKLGDALTARFELARGMAGRYQAPVKPLTKEETDTLVGTLKAMPLEQKSTYFAGLAAASGNDFDGYKALMGQIAADDPVTAHAGIMAGRGRLSTDAGFSPDPGQATNVSRLILSGQAILHPDRKTDGSPEKGKLWPMPADKDMDKVFQSYERDAFAGRAEARNGFMQTAKAIYAARTVEAGDSTGVLDGSRWEESIKLATGGIDKWNGKGIVMPWGYSKGQFKDSLYTRIDDLVDSERLQKDVTASKLRDMPLESIGDGRYLFRAGDGVMVDRAGKPLVVDFNQSAAFRPSGKAPGTTVNEVSAALPKPLLSGFIK